MKRILGISALIGITFGYGSSVKGVEIALVPVGASGAHTIVGDQIILSTGGQRVELEIQISDWGSAVLLQTWQAQIEASSYSSGPIGVLTPAVEACSTSIDCVIAFQNLAALCSLPSTGPPFTLCGPGMQDLTRPDWIHSGLSVISGVDLSTLSYRFGSTPSIPSQGAVDDGSTKYGGVLFIDVPADALGSFVFSLLPAGTFATDTTGQDLPNLVLSSGTIKIPAGACCRGFPKPLCQVTTAETCASLGGSFTADGDCSGVNPCPCTTNPQCNDSDACTTDECDNDGFCQNDLLNPAGQCDDGSTCNANLQDCGDASTCEPNICCDPSTGANDVIDDGLECTDDVCNPDGSVDHNSVAAGTTCGDSSSGECDDPDTCDASGNCGANHAAQSTACGDDSDTDCTDPDMCDGFGACSSNDVADNTACDDGVFCNVGEVCTNGVCGGGGAIDCDDGLPCTTDSCVEGEQRCDNSLDAGTCLIAGVCYADGELNPENDCQECNTTLDTNDWSFRSSGNLCDDGDPCTGTGGDNGFDTCDGAGVCSGATNPDCNDTCGDAVEIFVGTSNFGTNANRGPDDAEASCTEDSNNDVWFFHVSSCTGTLFLSTTGSQFAPSNDPVLNVFDACGGNEIVCDDDSGVDLQAALSFEASVGVTYWIRVAGFEDNVGPVTVNISTVDGCLIDNVCVAPGELNPTNDCEACVVDVSTSSWTPLAEGQTCGDTADDECNALDTCDGAGLCQDNFKPDGTVCPDDGNECTDDECLAGSCDHPNRLIDTPCGDVATDTECDKPDSCDGSGACRDNFLVEGEPCGDPTSTQCNKRDICDGVGFCDDNLEPDETGCADGDSCTANDACQAGVCVGIPDLDAPLVEALGSRFLLVTPQPGAAVAEVSLRITSPDWPCLNKFIQPTGALGNTPVFLTPATWGTILVSGQDIIPGTPYDVVAECGTFVSSIGSDTTWLFADMNNDGRVDFIDIEIITEAFKGLETGVALEVLDVFPCTPDGIIDFLDIQTVVEAFRDFPFPCGEPCQ